jgi:hypothetical protein
MHPQLLNDRGSKRPFDVSFRHVCANGHTMGNKAWPNSLENQIVTKLNTLSHQLVAALFQKSLPKVGPSACRTNPGQLSFDEGQRPSHGPRCDHQYDRGREQ